MYLGVEEGGVIRTRDKGKTFEVLNHGIYTDVHNLVVDPHESRRLYATTGRGFYRSDNAGSSWQFITRGIGKPYTVPLLVHPIRAGIVYIAGAAGPPPTWFIGANGADATMFVSRDFGESFETSGNEEEPMRGMVMKMVQSVDHSDEIFGVTTDGAVLRSTDRGETFKTFASNLPPAYSVVALP